jgi:hypothetical protein
VEGAELITQRGDGGNSSRSRSGSSSGSDRVMAAMKGQLKDLRNQLGRMMGSRSGRDEGQCKQREGEGTESQG